MAPRRIDINSDVGEGLDDEVLMPYLTSVSVACGAHAGNGETMARTLGAARRHGLRAGAHPGYPDRAGFGRAEIDISPGDLGASLREQIANLAEIAGEVGIPLTHVKAHGALYNRAWRHRPTADIVAHAALAFDPRALVFCPAHSAQEDAARAIGLGVVREVFLDRGYRPDGTLLQRGESGAVIDATAELDAQLSFLEGLEFQTMCVHGDNPAAPALLGGVPTLLAGRGWQAAPYAVAG